MISPNRGENKKYLKPPPRKDISDTFPGNDNTSPQNFGTFEFMISPNFPWVGYGAIVPEKRRYRLKRTSWVPY